MSLDLMEHEVDKKFNINPSDYPISKVAFLTSGGLAPCLNSVLAALVTRYRDVMRSPVTFVFFKNGFHGLLKDDKIILNQGELEKIHLLHGFGGSSIGNSRTKLANEDKCRDDGLIGKDETAFDRAARVLEKNNIDVLHTIGGDDTNTEAAKLAKYLRGRAILIIGMPKTIDNDIVPLKQSLGAMTAAEQGAVFFENVVNEGCANPRCLVIHEVMGRSSGWLTARSAYLYRHRLSKMEFLPSLGLSKETKDVHGVYLPEYEIDYAAEGIRLKEIIDKVGCVNVFISEGAGALNIVKEMEAAGVPVKRDAFGHVKLDQVNVGEHFRKKMERMIDAKKVLVQKSGYFCRSASANPADRMLIQSFADYAVECARKGISGLIGVDYEWGGVLRAIEFNRIRGQKPFFGKQESWFVSMMEDIGQEIGPETESVRTFMAELDAQNRF